MKEMYSKQVNITSRFANDLQIGLILFQVQSASITVINLQLFTKQWPYESDI